MIPPNYIYQNGSQRITVPQGGILTVGIIGAGTANLYSIHPKNKVKIALPVTPFLNPNKTAIIGSDDLGTGGAVDVQIDSVGAIIEWGLGTSTTQYAINNGVMNTTNPFYLKRLRTGLAKVMSGSGNLRIACFGDSTTSGSYADGVNVFANNKINSYPSFLSKIFIKNGLPSTQASMFGDASAKAHSSNIYSYDPRFVGGISWTNGAAGPGTAGGSILYSVATALGTTADETLVFTPAEAWDTCDLYYLGGTTLGTFTLDTGGAVLATCHATLGTIQKVTINKGAPSVGPLNIIRTVQGSNVCAIGAIRCYNSTVSEVEVWNVGAAGITTGGSALNANSYDPVYVMKTYAPDVVIINLGINDVITSVNAQVTYDNLVSIITNLKTVSDVVINIPNPQATTYDAAFNKLRIAIQNAALFCGINLSVDIDGIWGTVALSSAYMYSDNIHPIKTGYYDIASLNANFLLS
jgi:lysophospholipase L1-like esterase